MDHIVESVYFLLLGYNPDAMRQQQLKVCDLIYHCWDCQLVYAWMPKLESRLNEIFRLVP